ncbi:RNA polymerase sigma factor [Oceanibaculum nanhaiense]|uniref:RNA polymerase sigma factor n=1 Tax=Oceanibaculum nanhaiense TaxID=1909734 RepID=UPI00396E9E37
MIGKDIRGLFLAHRAEIQAYLTRKLRNAELAAELTQEAFLRFAEQGQAGSAVILHERSYLYRVAHNLAVDHLRLHSRERLEPLGSDMLDAIADDSPSPEQVAGGHSELARLRRILMELPERTRAVFVLTRIDLLTYHETAARLEISESSVQKHLAQAVKHVMQRLRSDDAGI